MNDCGAWVEEQPQVTNLQLDAQNSRIPASGDPLGQRELIAELVQHDKVYELAREIADRGYSPIEAMIGVVEDGRQIILERNRRLAALKLLISPESAPDPASVRRFRHLAAGAPLETIKKVACFAPNREAAAPHSLKVTVDIYGHLVPGANRDADRLDVTGRNPVATARTDQEAGVTEVLGKLVELRGFEPLTPRLPALCSPN